MRSLFLFVVLIICACNTQDKDILVQICEANNLTRIYASKELNFTFNVEKSGKLLKSRAWKWDIGNDKIYQDGKEVGKSPAYINDMYWLVFPLMVLESRDQVELTVNKDVPAPYSKIAMTELSVKYISDKGKSPNDTYKIYVDDELVVKEWAYFRASQKTANRVSHWREYKKINDVNISLDRPSEDGFRIYFTDITLR